MVPNVCSSEGTALYYIYAVHTNSHARTHTHKQTPSHEHTHTFSEKQIHTHTYTHLHTNEIKHHKMVFDLSKIRKEILDVHDFAQPNPRLQPYNPLQVLGFKVSLKHNL